MNNFYMKNSLKNNTLICIFFFLLFMSFLGYAEEPENAKNTEQQVFTLSTMILPAQGGIQLHWNIADNAYLYQKFITIVPLDPDNVHVGMLVFPPGEIKKTQLSGDLVIYHDSLNVNVPIENKSGQSTIALKVSYQGCSEEGQCFPPITKILTIDFSDANNASKESTQQSIQEKLSNQSIAQMILLFLALGFFLALTPCILPMIPILSSIILQKHHHKIPKTNKFNAFFLSLSYVLGISIAYALLGYLMSSLGNHIQSIFQNPIIIIIFGFIFVLLALSLFGLFELKLIHKTNHKLAHITHKISNIASKNYLTVTIMGFLSALVISPCVTPPLVGVLAYIATTGNIIMGTTLLFCMGFGMGIPLLIIGVLENKFLPKAGAWMEIVKLILGLILLGMAVALWQRVIPINKIPLLWGGFIVFISILLFYQVQLKTKFTRILFQTVCFLGMLYGALPVLEHFTGRVLFSVPQTSAFQNKTFITATSVDQLQDYLATAKKEHRPVMIDFYASWCLDCQSMEANVFNQQSIRRELERFLWIKVDMSTDSPPLWALQEEYNIAGPPTFLFYSANGKFLESLSFVGLKSDQEILDILKKID